MPPIVPPQTGAHRRTARRPVKCNRAARAASRRRPGTMESHTAIARWVNEGGAGDETEA